MLSQQNVFTSFSEPPTEFKCASFVVAVLSKIILVALDLTGDSQLWSIILYSRVNCLAMAQLICILAM